MTYKKLFLNTLVLLLIIFYFVLEYYFNDNKLSKYFSFGSAIILYIINLLVAKNTKYGFYNLVQDEDILYLVSKYQKEQFNDLVFTNINIYSDGIYLYTKNVIYKIKLTKENFDELELILKEHYEKLYDKLITIIKDIKIMNIKNENVA